MIRTIDNIILYLGLLPPVLIIFAELRKKPNGYEKLSYRQKLMFMIPFQNFVTLKTIPEYQAIYSHTKTERFLIGLMCSFALYRFLQAYLWTTSWYPDFYFTY